MRVPSHLLELGLGVDASTQDVRRAYAKRLKQIDQATELPAFQRLREVYEQALAWCELPHDRRNDQQDEAVVLDRAAIAAELHARFASTPCTSEDDAHTRLTQLLADERLIDLELRAQFERLCIEQLASGWRPGHEFVFDAATRCFAWDVDHDRLAPHGSAGAVIEAALVERNAFEEQEPALLPLQRDLMQRIRASHKPSDTDLFRTNCVFEWLCEHYRHWLHISVGVEHLKQWRAWHEGLPRERQSIDLPYPEPTYPPEWLGKPPKAKSGGPLGQLLVFLYFIACLIGGLVLAAWLNRGP